MKKFIGDKNMTRELTEFEKDLIKLNEAMDNKDLHAYRKIVHEMFYKMRDSYTKEHFRSIIDEVTLSKTGKNFKRVYFLGFNR